MERKEACIFAGIIAALLLLVVALFVYPAAKGAAPFTGKAVAKTNADYYEMFLCSCCDEPISENCCGMAKDRMQYVDQLLTGGLSEEDILYEMVKKYGEGVLADQTRMAQVKEYIREKAPENPPRIELETERLDMGVVSQGDGIKTAEVKLSNSGKSGLVIEGMDTSCMCTSASIVYNGKEGPKFGMSMHGENPRDFRISIPPGESAELKIYFDPNAHGPQKTPRERLVREIIIISNDPENFQKKLRIDIVQVP